MDKIIIPFDGRKESDIDGTGVVALVSYKTLRRCLEKVVDLHENEVIAGLRIDNDGITVKFETVK